MSDCNKDQFEDLLKTLDGIIEQNEWVLRERFEFDADIVEAGTSKNQRERIKTLKQLIDEITEDHGGRDGDGAPVKVILKRASSLGMDQAKAEHEIDKLKYKGEVYEPAEGHLRTT